MNELNSKRLENYIQEAKKVLLETEMLSYSIKSRSIKLKLSENVIPNLIKANLYTGRSQKACCQGAAPQPMPR